MDLFNCSTFPGHSDQYYIRGRSFSVYSMYLRNAIPNTVPENYNLTTATTIDCNNSNKNYSNNDHNNNDKNSNYIIIIIIMLVIKSMTCHNFNDFMSSCTVSLHDKQEASTRKYRITRGKLSEVRVMYQDCNISVSARISLNCFR